MTIVHKSVLQNYSAKQMFALVENIEAYPTFLPWCDSVDVQRDASRQTAIATLSLNFAASGKALPLTISMSRRNPSK